MASILEAYLEKPTRKCVDCPSPAAGQSPRCNRCAYHHRQRLGEVRSKRHKAKNRAKIAERYASLENEIGDYLRDIDLEVLVNRPRRMAVEIISMIKRRQGGSYAKADVSGARAQRSPV